MHRTLFDDAEGRQLLQVLSSRRIDEEVAIGSLFNYDGDRNEEMIYIMYSFYSRYIFIAFYLSYMLEHIGMGIKAEANIAPPTGLSISDSYLIRNKDAI